MEAGAPLHSVAGRSRAPSDGYDEAVIDESPDDEPRTNQPLVPGERRLAHPPSDRYRVAEPEAEPPAIGTMARGVTFAMALAAIGALAIVVLGGVLAISAGLIVAAAATGWATGLGMRIGARGSMPPATRSRLALGLAVVSIVGGQLGLWLYARTEGGVLGPIEYLGETFGPLVPLQLLAASVAAWVSAR